MPANDNDEPDIELTLKFDRAAILALAEMLGGIAADLYLDDVISLTDCPDREIVEE